MTASCGVRQVAVAAGLVGKGHDEAVREAFRQSLQTGVGPRGDVEQAGDFVAQVINRREQLWQYAGGHLTFEGGSITTCLTRGMVTPPSGLRLTDSQQVDAAVAVGGRQEMA